MPSVAVLVPVYDFLEDHPTVLPALLVLALLAWLTSASLSRRIGCRRVWAALLVFSCTAPAAMTLLPHEVDLDLDPRRACVTAVRPLAEWGRGGEELANLLMLAPAGLLVVVLLRARPAVLVLLLLAASPVLVEAVQYALPSLRRRCETTDGLLNLSGLLLGVAVGLPVRVLSPARPGRDSPRSASPGA